MESTASTSAAPIDEEAELRQWEPLVRKLAARVWCSRRLLDREELEHLGRIALLRGVRTYRDGISSKMTWYWTTIERGLWSAVRAARAKRFRPLISLDALRVETDDGGIGFEPKARGPRSEDLIEDAEFSATMLAELPERQAFVLREHYYQGESIEAIAQRMGLSRSLVEGLRRDGLDRVSRWLEAWWRKTGE